MEGLDSDRRRDSDSSDRSDGRKDELDTQKLMGGMEQNWRVLYLFFPLEMGSLNTVSHSPH